MNACEIVCNFINIFANLTFDSVTFDLICLIYVVFLSHFDSLTVKKGFSFFLPLSP